MKKNVIVGQSGGPTAVINSSLAGVIYKAIVSGGYEKVYGTRYGIDGILNENIVDLKEFNDPEKIKILVQTPSAYLGSCRHKLKDFKEDRKTYEKIFDFFKKYNIGAFFYIGGNDSMDTVLKLSSYAKEINYDISIAGVPKTIDNDLCETDFTPGYGSSARFIANTVKQISLDNRAYDMESVIVVEIMGRNAGWLTGAAALCNDKDNTYVDMVILPETVFDLDKTINKVKEMLKVKKQLIIALSEGVKDKDGKYLCEYGCSVKEDAFSHKQMGGAGATLTQCIKEKLGVKIRNVELSVMQRAYSAMDSKADVEGAFNIGAGAVDLVQHGNTGFMSGFKRISDKPFKYEIVPINIEKSANNEKKVPQSMITDDGFNVTEEFIKYAMPLISEVPNLIYENGLIKTINL